MSYCEALVSLVHAIEAVPFSSCHGHLNSALIDTLPVNRSKETAVCIDYSRILDLLSDLKTEHLTELKLKLHWIF